MSIALSAGVTGLQAHQKMLDIAGNNLANVNTTAYKSSRITFAELISETIKKASQPTATVGGTNPQQMGSGVGIAGISPNMAQGNIVNTGNPLDMAIEGEGYFVLSDGEKNVYTRAGAFTVDANSYLVDPSTGYLVQRIGTVGESDGFQTAGESNVKVPYDVAMPARATTQLTVSGNLGQDAALTEAQINVLKSNISYTTGDGSSVAGTTLIKDLDQYSGTLTSGVITFSGIKSDGTAMGANPTTDLTMDIDATTTLNDILTWLNTTEGTAAVGEVQTVTLSEAPTGGTFTLTCGGETTSSLAWNATASDIEDALEALSMFSTGNVTVSAPIGDNVTIGFADTLGDVGPVTITSLLTGVGGPITGSIAETIKGFKLQGILGSGATATLDSGRIVVTDASSGYSQSDLAMSYSGDGTLTMPGYFEVTKVGGTEVRNVSITVYDTLGGAHVISGSFVRTDTANTWDMIMTSISGGISSIGFDGRRINGIEFDETDGSYQGLNATTGDTANLVVTFAHDTANPQTLAVSMGTAGEFNGLTQFSGDSTAVARSQDGYEAGRLSSVSVSNDGVLVGAFSNGIKKDLAMLQIAFFQNAIGLESVGSGYFIASANSGSAVSTQAMSGSVGSIHGGSLEKSNADVASEFVNMIQAQNGFQANARTIRVANDILRELSNLIR